MLIGESKESDEDVHDGERHKPDIRQMPSVVVAGRSRGHDVGQVLNYLLLELGRRLSIVSNHVLGGHDVARSLDELDRYRSERRLGFVGQLVGVFDEVFRNDPTSESSGYQVKRGQRSFLTMGSLDRRDLRDGFQVEAPETVFAARYPNTLNGYPKISKKLRVGRLRLGVSSVARMV